MNNNNQQVKRQILVCKEFNFESQVEMKQYADSQTQKLQTINQEPKQEIQQVKGNALYSQIYFQDKIQNEQSNISKDYEKFIKQRELKKFTIISIDKKIQLYTIPLDQRIQLNSRIYTYATNSNANIIQNKKQQLTLPFIQKKQLIQELQQQKIQEKFELDRNFQIQNKSKTLKIDKLKISQFNHDQYLCEHFEKYQQIQKIIEILEQNIKQIQNQINHNQNQYYVNKMQLSNSSLKIQFNCIKCQEQFEKDLENNNFKISSNQSEINQLKEQLNILQLDKQQISQTQNQNVSRKQKFQNKYIENQIQSQINDLEQQNKNLLEESEQKQQNCKYYKDYYKNQYNQLESDLDSLVQVYEQKNSELNFKKTRYVDLLNSENKKKLLYEEQLKKIQMRSQETLQQIEQTHEDFQVKIQEYENKKKEIEEHFQKQIEQLRLKSPKLPLQELRQYQSQQQQELSETNLFLQSQNDYSYVQNFISKDEIYYQKNKVAVLQLLSIQYKSVDKWITNYYQTKWLQFDQQSLVKSLFFTARERQILQIEVNYNRNKIQLISNTINAYSEQLFIIDQETYFRNPKNIRLTYPRLFIFPIQIIDQFNKGQAFEQERWIKCIFNCLQDYEMIQYQFWLIYRKIAFIINQENQLFYIITIHLNDRLAIIYNSIPQNTNKYNQIMANLNLLFSLLLKEKIELNMHISPTFPIQNNLNETKFYACIALEYFSRYQVNKEYKSLEEIKEILQNIKLKRTIV